MILCPSIALLLAAFQQQDVDLALNLEGPLNNDAFVLTHEAAQGELARGDRSWKRAQADPVAGTRERGLAYEAWHSALDTSDTGDAVNLADPDVEIAGLWADPEDSHGRRAEGVAYAVLRRLHALDPRERLEWVERFSQLAQLELAQAGAAPARLARVERNHPWTESAALAALRLSDLALERGETANAHAWLERARDHAGGASQAPTEVERAIDGRVALIETWTLSMPETAPARVADALELVRAEPLEGLPSGGMRQTLRGGLEPGLVFTESGSVIIQTPVGLVHYRDDQLEVPRTVRTRFRDLLGEDWNTPYVTTAEGGWPLLPAIAGDEVVLVVGRSIARTRGVSFAEGNRRTTSPTNILTCLHIDNSGLPEIVWTLSSAGLLGADDSVIAEDLFGSDEWEVQPGPCVHEGRVFAVVRVLGGAGGGEHELWLWAFDLATGEPLWSRFLTKPSGLPGEGAAARSRHLPTPGQPLSVIDGRVFVGTNAGLGLLFDSVDGRLVWSFRNRRRARGTRGWTGARRAPRLAGTEGPLVAWTPFDSDQLYILAATPDLDGRGIMRRSDLAPIAAGAPYAIGEAEELAGASAEEILVLGRSGPRPALGSWLPGGERRSSIYLGHGEGFAGSSWTSRRRILTASTRYLYLFDRDLRLLDTAALPEMGGGRGGSAYVWDDRVFVLGQDTLWHFRSH